MVIKKELVISAMTTDGKVMEDGKSYIFEISEGKCLAGVFKGISKKGALMFESHVSNFLVTFNVMPTSIDSIYEADIKIIRGDK